jgi:hypothetical protein
MMKKIYAFSVMFLIGITLFADDKAPVALDDYAQAVALQTIAIPVLENDFAYDDHPFKIQIVLGSQNGITTFNDSIVFYTPKSFFRGIDSLRYRIIDLENNLISEYAKIYIEVANDCFDFLDVNQVRCRVLSNGMFFYDLHNYTGGYEVPANSGVQSIFSKSLWMGGFDQNGELHVAGERYRQIGADYYAGPVSDTVHYNQDFDVLWNRVWKLNKSDILYHEANWPEPGYEPIENILLWPGNGNAELGQAELLAPFFDRDNNGIYNPYNGDVPLIKGDQAIFFIYNDDRSHGESKGKKLGAEIHAMFYAYDRPEDSALSQTVFGSFNIINRSQKDYSDFYTAFFMDFDIGYAYDDYIGCDTTLHSAFAYNGNAIDGDGGAETYGGFPPAQSFTCLNYDMDAFMYFNNTDVNPAMRDPTHAYQYYNYMKGIWKDSTFLTYGGNGYGGEIPVNYIFPGDPAEPDEWSEVSAAFNPFDRRGLISHGPIQFNAGDTLNLDFALVFARDYEGDHLTSVALLKDRIQQVKDFYQEALGVEEIHQDSPALKVYPNPFSDELFVETASFSNTINWSIINMLGNTVSDGKAHNQPLLQLDVKNLRTGIYFLRISDGKQVGTSKIVKMW